MNDSERPRPRILYIDDDQGLTRLVERHLARSGFDVTSAESGEKGLEFLRSQSFDLAALDHHMPGIGGLETLKRICAMPDHLPVIYVTGAEDSRLAVTALKTGATDYVVKSDPHDFFELLIEAVRQAFARVSAERERERAVRAIQDANERLEKLVAQQEIMLREVNHRVANSLQMMSALVRMQIQAAKDEAVRRALLDTQGRIEAIIQVHRRLYTSTNVEVVQLGQYLKGLANELQQSLGAAERNLILSAEVQETPVPTDTAVALGVIVGELVTNAVKYAFEGKPGGRIVIRLQLCDGAPIVSVIDDGIGFGETDETQGTGLGSTVVRVMAKSLNAEVSTISGPRGTEVRISLPASVEPDRVPDIRSSPERVAAR